jgi:hypothetical protein
MSSMTRHLEACRQKAGEKEYGTRQETQRMSVFHLLVEGEPLPMYWLHLEVATDVTLETLDQFLRAIWLECCGHLSAFTIDDAHYCADEEMGDLKRWQVGRRAMQTTLGVVMRPGQSSIYEYDFGTTTELRLKVITAREVETQNGAIRILARNTLPPIPCNLCGQPATSVCLRCWYGSDDYERELEERAGAGLEEEERAEQGYLCAICAASHQHRKADLKPLRRVNSPRAGVCGYTGPKNPLFL